MDDLDSLLVNSRGNRDRLAARISELRDDRTHKDQMTSEALAARFPGIISKSQIDNFIRRKSITEAGYQVLIQYLWDNGLWKSKLPAEDYAEHPQSLFFSLCAFLNVGQQTKSNLRNEIAGTFRVWRSSMHFPGGFLLGKMVVSIDMETGAVTATETHIFKGNELAAAHREVFEGFLVKKSRYFMIVARQTGRHKGAPRMTMIHNALYGDGIVRTMQGVVTGCYGSNMMFSTPVYFERVEGAEAAALDDQLDVRSDMPESIRAKLQFRFDGNVIRF